ncbi:MAG: sortase [Oscillospiraceae bacterium]
MIAALLLFSRNRMEDYRAGKQAEETLRAVEAAMDARGGTGETETTPAPDAAEPAAATAENAPGASASPGAATAGTETGSSGLPAPLALDMPTVRTGSYDYIGYLDFPGYGLTMPVAAEFSFPAMEISPCRHTGSVYNDNLVVAGHNYKTEFDVLFRLKAGDTVTFTDVDGNVFTYTVREFASVTPDDSDTVMNSGYALTMYTCNWDTTERVTVFCERTGGDLPETD